jgi:hypothetical protein
VSNFNNLFFEMGKKAIDRNKVNKIKKDKFLEKGDIFLS